MTLSTQTKSFAAGERIITENDDASCAYLILSGEVSVFREENTKHISIATLKTGDIFGEAVILQGGTYGANVDAKTNTELSIITASSFQSLVSDADPVLRALLHMLIERLKNTNEALLQSETREFIDIAFV